jgi:hypothetical protein
MGASLVYLDKPDKTKHSEDKENAKERAGASGM